MLIISTEKYYFYPRPPRGGRPHAPTKTAYNVGISIHALREEGDPTSSTFSARNVISIHALREEGDVRMQSAVSVSPISIHALREEGDRPRRGKRGGVYRISIHALREEGDGSRSIMSTRYRDFYPRPPRGGRLLVALHKPCHKDFYPRPPRGGRHVACVNANGDTLFLSTPSARRATLRRLPVALELRVFLSTPSARRATPSRVQRPTPSGNFYPRPPRGGRRGRVPGDRQGEHISIHALREEGDSSQASPGTQPMNFYPRPPRGGRPPC